MQHSLLDRLFLKKDCYKNRKCIYRTKLYNFSFGGNDADHEDNVEDEDDKSLKSLNEDRGTYLLI